MSASINLEISKPLLHLRVLLTIADSYSRQKKASYRDKDVKILGCLLGFYNNGKKEIADSFEMPSDFVGSKFNFDYHFFEEKMKTIDKVPSFSYSFLGWYTICSTKDLNPLPEHLEFHKLVISSTSLENPYFLILSTNESYYESQGNYLYSNLPIELYETSLTTLNGPEINFVRRSFELTSNEMERITINFLSCNADTIESPEESSLRPRKCAKAIYYKIKLLLEYLQDVKEGILKKDSSLLREITTICDLLSNDEQLKQEHFEYDVTALLSGLTKGYLLLRKLQ